MLRAIVGLAAAGVGYFLTSWLFSLSSHKRATLIQRANATIAEAKRLEQKQGLRARIHEMAGRRGWTGTLTPLLAGFLFLYIGALLILSAVGLGLLVGAIAGVPLCLGISWTIVRRIDGRRKELFRRQLLQALDLLASQIEAGSGPQRALTQIVNQIDNPLGEELERTLAEATASKELIPALEDLYWRYPVKALAMLIAAFEIDQQVGSKLGPVLRSAAVTLSREFELTAEAQAEVSQTRSEFYIVAGIILFICFYTFAMGGPVVTDAFHSPAGIIVLALAGLNFAWGIFRITRILSKASGRA